MRSFTHILATSALVVAFGISAANAMNPAAATKVDAPDPSQNPNANNQYIVGQSNQPGGPGGQMMGGSAGDQGGPGGRANRGQGGPDMGGPDGPMGKVGQDNQAYGDNASDSVKAELKVYFEKKKALRDALSPQAKAVLDKRRDRNMRRDEMGGDEMMGGPGGGMMGGQGGPGGRQGGPGGLSQGAQQGGPGGGNPPRN